MKPNKLLIFFNWITSPVFMEQHECDLEKKQEKMQEGYMLCTRPPSLLFIVHLGFDNVSDNSHQDGRSFTAHQCSEHNVSERAHLTGESSANDRLDIVGREVTVFGGVGGGGGRRGGVYLVK